MKETFKEFTKYLISNIASEFTIRKLSHIFEVKDVHTVKNWIDALESSYLFFILERCSPKLKQQIIAPKKIYCIDNGLEMVSKYLSLSYSISHTYYYACECYDCWNIMAILHILLLLF
jgi:predicted AAA+ superfamily ATPase